ncbi:hypothetical protein SAMN02745119_01956 [Trichlorobacter thiogenes]|uniref:Uncharacterized protein n=1 Tax=Trichlorobacter thiogenes TaxID=115783 RepID=A0A1T4PE36_9BACT|nr:hypothetical protein [Trichlorobacter thiogenes]SJZ89772.1 hypothetical protein SAMN02745119_01956 [Trichlorobacter thiogenes]
MQGLNELNPYRKRIIVVLGMHRSGTSMVTCGLNALGVALGDRLNPPAAGDNDKGFFEDLDVLELNIQMLQTLKIDWHYLTPVESIDIDILNNHGFFSKAVELLRYKTADFPVWGFKDPRVAKLIPFWNRVFAHCGFDVGYVLAIRNPLSVVKSLLKRDKFNPEKSYLLWLGHVLSSLLHSKNYRRTLIDFDSFIQYPQKNLEQISSRLDLSINPHIVKEYLNDFLDESLRHSVFSVNDLAIDQACPPLVRELYASLLEVSCDNSRMDVSNFHINISQRLNEFDRLKSTLRWMDDLWNEASALNLVIEERNTQIENLNHTVTESNTQIENLNHTVTERNTQIENLNHTVTELKHTHHQQLLEICQTLDQKTVEQRSQLAEFEQAYKIQLEANQRELHDLVSQMKEVQIANEKVANQLCSRLDDMHSTNFWRWSAPFRSFAEFLGKKKLLI